MFAVRKIVLGIETSCDDTSVCLMSGEPGIYCNKPEILSLKHTGQQDILKPWGGVVPEIAARNHLAKLTPMLKEAFKEASLGPREIDLIGVTTTPGLLGPLLTGLNCAKTIALIHQTPLLPVNHLYAHLEAIHLTDTIDYPYLGLIASGGHTLFLLARSEAEFEVLGTTLDDAAGEAFDKGGKLMGLGYPAGKAIDELARRGDCNKYPFPIGLKSTPNANLSFSGLKTALQIWMEKNNFPQENEQQKQDLCASYQEAIVEALRLKTRHALNIAHSKTGQDLKLVIGGGVASNSRLREVMTTNFANTFFVAPRFCTDNAAMIANYALRTCKQEIHFPASLELDAVGRFIDKNILHKQMRSKKMNTLGSI